MALRLALWCGTVRLPLSPQSAYTSIRQLPFESRGEAGFFADNRYKSSSASLPQPHHLKLCGGFAKSVSLAKADAKDLSHLLGGICPLNAFPFRSHMFSFHCAAHLWITVPPSDFSD